MNLKENKMEYIIGMLAGIILSLVVIYYPCEFKIKVGKKQTNELHNEKTN